MDIFHQAQTRLRGQGFRFDDKELLDILHRVSSGEEYLTERFPNRDWWAVLDKNAIDVSSEEKSPFWGVVSGLGIEAGATMWPGDIVARLNGLIPIDQQSNFEIAALNWFWGILISKKKQVADPLLISTR